MKRYHPSGSIRNGDGTIKGMLLRDTSARPRTGNVKVVSVGDFFQLVKDNSVQLFAWNGSEVVHTMTPQEQKVFRKGTKHQGSAGPLSLQEYFNGEAEFDTRGVESPTAVNFSLVLLRVAVIIGAHVVTGAVYMQEMPRAVLASVKRNSLYSSILAENYLICNWEMSQLLSLMSTLSTTYTVTCNINTMLNPNNPLTRVPALGFNHADVSDLNTACDLLSDWVSTPGAPTAPLTKMDL